MQKITPNLWFNGNAEEAVDFYQDVFRSVDKGLVVRYPDSQDEGLADFQLELAGDVLTIDFRLFDMEMTAINAGAEFEPNPSISFMINFDPSIDDAARGNLDRAWQRLSDGGKELMPLGKYDFSDYYGWVQDRYGFSWQLILTDPEGEPRPKVIPSLMFAGEVLGRAEEAREFYAGVFSDSMLGDLYRYEETNEMFVQGQIMWSELKLENQWFVINDGGPQQDFTFTEAVSLLVLCKDQGEIDYFWEKLSAATDSEQCGWCKDKYGVSWQIIPENMAELMEKPGGYKTLLEQKKIIISEY